MMMNTNITSLIILSHIQTSTDNSVDMIKSTRDAAQSVEGNEDLTTFVYSNDHILNSQVRQVLG
jgi:hypothetical protein